MSSKIDEHRTERESRWPRVSQTEALKCILSHTVPICESEIVGVLESVGRVLSEDVIAPRDVPNSHISMMDGYAVISSDSSNPRRVVSVSLAGSMDSKMDSDSDEMTVLKPGTVSYVTTGGMIPRGADSVIPVEQTSLCKEDSRLVTLDLSQCTVKSGQFIRPPGCDIRNGEKLLRKSTVITSAEIATMVMSGVHKVSVLRRPIVAVLSTGDELFDIRDSMIKEQSTTVTMTTMMNDDTAVKSEDHNSIPQILTTMTTKEKKKKKENMVFDCNRPMILTMINELECQVRCLDAGIQSDKREALKKKILELSRQCDAVICSGGVSMGSRDWVKPILDEIGHVHFGRVHIKPGLPTTFATTAVIDPSNESSSSLSSSLLFGLPGNPVSCAVQFRTLVSPCLKKLCGIASNYHHSIPSIPVKLCSSHPTMIADSRPEFKRALLSLEECDSSSSDGTPGLVALVNGNQRSSRVRSLVNANCLLYVPPDTVLKPGDITQALWFDRRLYDERTAKQLVNDDLQSADESQGSSLMSSVPECQCGGTSSSSSSVSSSASFSSSTSKSTLMTYRVGVVTISDRALAGEYRDESGPLAMKLIREFEAMKEGLKFVFDSPLDCPMVIPDERDLIEKTLKQMSDSRRCHLIVTTGGTGHSKRDVTPEATKSVIQKECPGLVHLLFADGLKHTPFAVLSRLVAGIRNDYTLIVNLPGSKKAVKQCLESLLPVVPHALKLMSR